MSAGAPSPWVPRLRERDEALGRVAALVEAATAGRGRVAVVRAEAGSGKTRLLEAAAERGRRAGMRVLVARGMPLEQLAPYGVVRQLLDPVVDADGAARLTGPAAAAAIALGAGDGAADPADDPTFSVRYGLVALTAALAREGPLLLVVDDAHWADTPSLRYLLLLAGRLVDLPVLLLVAHRPPAQDEHRHLDQLAASPGAEPVAVGPLGVSSVAALLAEARGGATADGALLDGVMEATGGNPFLVVEVARSPAREPVPAAVARSVLLRLAQAGPAARRVADSLAILGDGCPATTLAAFAGLDLDEAAAGADALRVAAILDSGPALAFLHPLIGAAVEGELAPGARERAHARAAALLRSEGRPALAVARHLLRTEPAGDEATAAVLADAAEAALRQGAPDTAVQAARRALRETRDAGVRADLHELLLRATVDAADVDGLAPLGDDPVYDELVETIMADPERLRRRAATLATWLAGTGRVAEAVELADRAGRIGIEQGDLRGAVEMEAQLVVLAQLPPPDALARLDRYRDHLVPGSREARLVLGLDAWWAGLLGGAATEAAALARRALDGNRDLADDLCAAPFQLATLVLARADDLDGAHATAEAIVVLADARGSVAARVTGRYLRASVAYRRGDLGAAERDVRAAIDLARLRGLLLVIPLMSALLTNVLVDRDAPAEADRVLDLGAGPGAPPGGYWLGPVRFARGRLRLVQGRAADAAAELDALTAQSREWSISGYAGTPAGAVRARALLARGEGDQDGARAAAEDEVARARAWGAPSVVAEALGGLGVAAGGEEGVALLRQAVEQASSSPARLVHAAALIDLGTALRRLRRAREGRLALREGLAIARQCGALRLARVAAGELEAGGERAVRHSAIGAGALTATEHRVAEMAAAGMSNREIAAARYVSIKTVESHLRAAYDKLGIRARGELAAVLTAG